METFFASYAAAFNQLDAAEIIKHYHLPCALSDGDGRTAYTDASALLEKFQQNCRDMEGFGFQTCNFSILSEVDLGEAGKAVHIGWQVHTPAETMDFRCLYVCHKVGGAWKIFNANVYPGPFV